MFDQREKEMLVYLKAWINEHQGLSFTFLDYFRYKTKCPGVKVYITLNANICEQHK